MKANYKRMNELATNAIGDLAILAGETVGPSDATWHDVAGTCAVNLRALADQLEMARNGESEPFLSFPSPSEIIEKVTALTSAFSPCSGSRASQ